MGEVVLDGVTKRFGDVIAVDDLTLEVRDREFLVLLGPSGCGKSTALRMIAGLEEPTSGSIRIGDRVVDDVEPRDRDIAMVFQSYALYPHMTVRRNIEFPLRSRKTPSAERDALVAEATRTLDLNGLLDRKPAQLSGGQRQRVALARAIVRRPAAFLMDEPLSNLDAKLRVQTRAELVELHRRIDTTVVYVTHDQVEAMTMGERIAILEAGRLQQVAAPQDVYDRPANRFVAGFIGNPAMSLLEGDLREEHDALVLAAGGASFRLPDDAVAGARAAGSTRAVVGVRPEFVRIDPAGEVEATVTVVEALGHERLVICRTSTSESMVVRQPAHASTEGAGTGVRLSVDTAQLHFFDAATGERLA